MIYKWQKQQEKHGESAFPGNGHTTATAEAKIAELERLIGQMTVENAFLKRVLTTLEVRKATSGEAR
jgi:transposase-like protein